MCKSELVEDHTIKIYGRLEVQSHAFLNLPLDEALPCPESPSNQNTDSPPWYKCNREETKTQNSQAYTMCIKIPAHGSHNKEWQKI